MNKAEKFWNYNQNIVEKGESIFRKFHDEFITPKARQAMNKDADVCIHCGKTHGNLNGSVEVDLDDNNNSSYHKDFTDSVTGYMAMGKHCMKNLGIWKDAKAYIDLRKKYEQLKKDEVVA